MNMKKLLLVFFITAFLLFKPPSASAHLIGQASFFKMNGKYTNLYPVQTTSISSFILPQDTSPDNYLVNTPIKLEMDTSKLQIPQEIIDKTKFDWDFGDGTRGKSLI